MIIKATKQSFNDIKHVTIIKTWAWEELEIDKTPEEFNFIYENALNSWVAGIYLTSAERFLNFKSIETFYGKRKRLELPEAIRMPRLYEMWSEEKRILLEKNPEKYYEMERQDEERKQKNQEVITPILEKSFENRKKKFLLEREKILKDLEKREIKFGLESSKKKLEEFKILKNKQKILEMRK